MSCFPFRLAPTSPPFPCPLMRDGSLPHVAMGLFLPSPKFVLGYAVLLFHSAPPRVLQMPPLPRLSQLVPFDPSTTIPRGNSSSGEGSGGKGLYRASGDHCWTGKGYPLYCVWPRLARLPVPIAVQRTELLLQSRPSVALRSPTHAGSYSTCCTPSRQATN